MQRHTWGGRWSRDANEADQIGNANRPRDHCGFWDHVKVGI